VSLCTLFLLSRENSERGRCHEIEGGSDGAARSKLAYLAALYKIAARGVLIRAVPRSGASSLSPRCRFHESIWTLHKSRLSHARGPKLRFLKQRKWSAGGVEGRQTPRRGRNFGDAHILGALESIQPDIQGPSSTIPEVVICIFSCRPGTEPTWRLVKARPKPLEMEEGICDLLLLSAALTLACRQLDNSCMAQRARFFHKSSPELLAARILTVSHQNQPSNSSHTRHMMAETGPI